MRKQRTTPADPIDARISLMQARRDIQHRLDCREAIAVERYSDPVDEAVQLAERECVALLGDADTALLRQVTDALQRLAEKRWGVCEGCGEPIPPARLAALPWASLCVDCQTTAEEVEA